ncbi:MAG: hypothetical protein R3C44_08955 [Chloroflexota bacterium]
MGVMAVVAFITALPLLIFFYHYPYYFSFRLAYVANRGAGIIPGNPAMTWLLNVGRVIGGFFWQGETHLRHNLPGRPYLDIIQRILFVVGLVIAAWRWRKPETAFLLIWLGVMLLPSILSGDAPHFGRLVGAAPPAAMLVALGATGLLDRLIRPTMPQWVTPVALAILFLPSLYWTTRDYFVTYANLPDLPHDFYQADWQMGLFAASQPSDAALYLTPTQEEMATIYFALQDPDRLRSFSEGETLIPAGFPQQPVLYLLRPDELSIVERLSELFPIGVPGSEQDGYTPFEVEGEGERNWPMSPTPVTIGEDFQLTGWDIDQTADSLLVTLSWHVLREQDRDLTVFVHVEDDQGQVVAQTDRPPAGYPTTEWRPGEVVVDQVLVELPSDLAPGSYTITTGFYYLPTLERIGDAIPLATLSLGE